MGLTTSYEKIQKNLRTVDLFSSNEATTILVMSRSTGSLSAKVKKLYQFYTGGSQTN